RLVRVVAAGGVPDVAAGAVGGAGRPRLLGHLAATGAATGSAAAIAGGCGTRDLGGRVAQARAALVDLELDARALLAFLRLVRTLLEATGRDDAAALRQRARDVLGELAPAGRAEEQRLAVLPVVRRAVEA